jgi:squalene synthase HpnC
MRVVDGQVTALGRQVDVPAPRHVLARRGGENFAVAAAWIPGRERRLLLAIYMYARFCDELGDGGYERADELLDELERDVRGRRPASFETVAAALDLIAAAGLPREPLLDLIAANRQDQHVARYATFSDLLGYCRLSADPVGRLVLDAMGISNAAARPLSDAVCSGLQIVEHLQDVREDALRGRIYLPQADLAAAGVAEEELAGAGPAGTGLRRVIALEAGRARAMLVHGSALVGALRGWRRAAIAGYVAGGTCAIAALAAEGWDVLGSSPRPGRGARAAATTRLALRGSLT